MSIVFLLVRLEGIFEVISRLVSSYVFPPSVILITLKHRDPWLNKHLLVKGFITNESLAMIFSVFSSVPVLTLMEPFPSSTKYTSSPRAFSKFIVHFGGIDNKTACIVDVRSEDGEHSICFVAPDGHVSSPMGIVRRIEVLNNLIQDFDVTSDDSFSVFPISSVVE